MKPLKVLGAIKKDAQPCNPVYAIGKVLERGANLPGENDKKSSKDHTDYIDDSGQYNVVGHAKDHGKIMFPWMVYVVVGQIAHIHSEIHVESLYCQSGFLAHPRRNLSGVRRAW